VRAAALRPGVRRGFSLAWALLVFPAIVLGGCDTSFRFDDHDAGASDSPVATGDGATMTTPWTGSETCTSNCSLSCPGPRTCAGSCLGACIAICPRDSDCTLTSGRRTVVTCDHSRCALTLQDHSVVSCRGLASCDVVCSDGCSVDCGAEARCTLQCRGDEAPRTVTGAAGCPDTI
jgi:hypothetical protein